MIKFLKIFFIRVKNVLIRFCSSGVLCIGKNNNVKIPFRFFKHHITICGSNNRIEISNAFYGTLNIRINGDSNYIKIGKSNEGYYRIDVFPRQASKCNNTKIIIGDNVTTSGQVWLKVGDHNSSIELGNDTTISWDVSIWNVDGHAIFPKDDMEKKMPINIGKTLKVGSHCWIGKGASILKNVTLPDHTIVGLGAVVSKKDLTEPYCALAGNPAQIVKRNIQWDIRSPSDFIEVDV